MRLRVVLLSMCLAATAARADDVTDQIGEALKAYQNHDVRAALAALDAASNLMRQSRADGLKRLLPAPPPGWTADAAEATSVSVAIFGGGIAASRTYHNGSQQVDVQIAADSPMLQTVGALINSPLGVIGGMKTVVIGGRCMTYSENDRSYITLIADKVIVRVAGGSDTPDPTLKSFIELIDFQAIERTIR